MEFFEKVTAIQSKLKAPKGQFNRFGGYKYRSCEDILEALKPLLSEYQLFINISDDIKMNGTRYYIEATATLTDGINKVSSRAYAREEETKKGMDGSQITGAASSYARKYALNGLLAIDDTKDSDTTNTGDTADKYVCESCGKPFTDFDWKGNHYTAADAYEWSKKKNGRALCKSCADKEGQK